MLRLGAALRRDGYEVRYFAYLCAVSSFAEIAARLRRRLIGAPPLVAIGHSLGGLLLRAACSDHRGVPRRLVLLGTPNRSPRWARAVQRNPLYRAVTGDSGQLLADPARVDALPIPDVPTLVVAGDAGPRWRHTPTADIANDLVVAVDETPLAGARHRVLPVRHTFMMHAPAVIELVREECRAAAVR